MRSSLTPADHTRNYRARKKERGEELSKSRGGNSSKWHKAQFIGIDGEGENAGETEQFKVGSDGKTYRAARHNYTLLAASTGETLYSGGNRLETYACIDWLCDLGASYRKGIFVIFAGSYDINHILLFGFEKETLQKISRGETYEFNKGGIDYCIEYRARKSLSLKRGLSWNEKGKPVWKDKIILWDVFGFFQESFVTVMGKWLGKNHKHYALIERMKKLRGNFMEVNQKDINQYNAAELETLVELMEKVHGAINGLGLRVNRWDGAGSIAASMFRLHNTRANKRPYPISDALQTAIRTSYAGGRIEVCKIGTTKNVVYDYDINSAYPTVMHGLPCLCSGSWHNGKSERVPTGFTIIRCKFDFIDGMPFYPLWFRSDKMRIIFPARGEGWYWYPEFEAAQLCMGKIDVIEWWHYKPGCNHSPFSWIEEYYETRKQWTKNATEEWQKGGEKIIKLGLNSLYGKTAQQLGGTLLSPPTYHQMEWAGYITSATRARLYIAAQTNPSAVIGFATDGLFTTQKLDIETNTDKKLGAWDLKIFEGLTICMAGVYWWHKKEQKYEHFSRGFDKDSMQTPALIHDAWNSGFMDIDIPMHRLITMGSACVSETLWKMRGRFTTGFRTLRLDGKSNKRKPIDVKKTKPHLNLVDLIPAENVEFDCGYQDISFPYPVIWLDGKMTDEFENDLELQKETEDTINI